MAQYIPKSTVMAEIERRIKGLKDCHADTVAGYAGEISGLERLLSFLDTLKVKYDSLENFKSLQHISGDLKSTLQDWGYAPNLYYFDGNWHVDWISCEGGDSIKDFTGDTVEEAINKACNWFYSTFCNS